MTHILAMCPSTENVWRASKSIPYYVLKVAKSMVGYKLYIYCFCAVELCLDNSISKNSFVSWLGQTTCWYCWPTSTEMRLMYGQINPYYADCAPIVFPQLFCSFWFYLIIVFPKYTVVILEVMLWGAANPWNGSCMMTHILVMCPSTENIWRASNSIPYYVMKVDKSISQILCLHMTCLIVLR